MNPQEQNKTAAPDAQKNEWQKKPAADDVLSPGASDGKDAGFVKPADKSATESSTTKGSYGTK